MIAIDASSILHRITHVQLANVKNDVNIIAHSMLQSILYNADKFGASKTNPVIIALDSTSWRKKWFEENKGKFIELQNQSYKGSRTKSVDVPWDEIYSIYNPIMEGLSKHSDFHVIKIDGAEADDIIAVTCDYFSQKGEMVWVLSPDKDFIQLQKEGSVYVFDPMKNQWKPKMDPEKYKKLHIILGDKSDNIPAIRKGVGEKTAEKMLKDLDSLLQVNHELTSRYEFNRTLIDFDYIPSELREKITSEIKSVSWNYNQMELLKIFSKYKLNVMADKINRFKLNEGTIKTKLNSVHIENQKVKELVERDITDFFN